MTAAILLAPGQVIDQYRLEQTIHRGRATVVFAATDLGLGRRVALKVLNERYSRDPEVRRRLIEEVEAAASLGTHPHLSAVYRWGEVEGSLYFVAEFVDVVSLAALLVRSASGRTTMYLRATLRVRWEGQHLVSEVVSDAEVADIVEPTGNLRFDAVNDLVVIEFDRPPGEDLRLVLTIIYFALKK